MSEHVGLGEVRQFPAPLRTVVVERIRTAIITGALRRGDRIVESQLCKSMKVSRPLLREALRHIEAEGLIEVVPNVGPVIRVPSGEELRQAYDMIAVVAALCARYFALNGSKDDMRSFDACIDAIERALKKGDVEAVRATRQAYYEAFARGAHSPLTSKYLLQLVALVSGRWGTSMSVPGRPAEAVGEMRRLAEAIRERDPELAAAASMTLSRHQVMVVRAHLSAHEDSEGAVGSPS